MAERDSENQAEKRGPQAVLLIGAGRFAREAGAVLATLSSLDPGGERRLDSWREFGVADLEELLTQRPLEGLLILESGRIPGEDIGFVRRFLERHPGWRLAVIGTDKSSAHALLQLDRTQWLAWPPDLEELRALLGTGPAATPSRPAATPEREERPARKAPRRAAAPAAQNGGVEVGGLLEELLAGAALQGDATPRYQFRGEPFLVHHERALLREGLGGLLELARLCAGGTGLVRADVDPNGESVLVGLDFPRGGLPEKDLPTLFERAPSGVEEALLEGLALARGGAELLRELGGRVELAGSEPGRVKCEVRLPAHAPGPARSGRSGKPEDPFA